MPLCGLEDAERAVRTLKVIPEVGSCQPPKFGSGCKSLGTGAQRFSSDSKIEGG
jgi:hypothetical protein